MKLSTRIKTLDKGSDGWGVYYRARDMERAGEVVTFLSIGEHDFETDDGVLDAMNSSARAGKTGYAPVMGTAQLRAAIAADQGVTPQQVAVTSGGQSALFAAMCIACDPGDAVVSIDPYYATYPSTVRAAGAKFHTCPARPENGFQPTRDDLFEATKDARVLMINSPNNPTGAVYSAKTMSAIEEVSVAHDLWLISDEVYASQVHCGRHVAPRHLSGMAERTLTVGSFSKGHVMTGFRIGWLLGPDTAIAAMTSHANATTYGSPEFIQDAALYALQNGSAEAVAETYRRRRDAAVALLAQSSRLRVSPPDGGMYLMVDVRGVCTSGEDFAYGLLDDSHIAVMPGESFGAAAAGHVRIALTQPVEILESALKKVIAYAERRPT